MKLAKFHYTDLKGKETDRKVLVIHEPTDKLSGIDVTELDDESIGLLAADLNEVYERYLETVEIIKREYDVTHNYRQFLQRSILNLEEETL